MIGAAIVAHLSANSSVFEFVDGNGYVRIHPQIIPQSIPNTVNRVPAITYIVSNIDRHVGYCGTRATVQCTIELDMYALTYALARELADEVRKSLIDYRGLMGGLLEVSACSLSTEFDTQDIEPGLYRVVQSWVVWYKES